MKRRMHWVGWGWVALVMAFGTASCIGGETNWLDGPDEPNLDPADQRPPKPALFGDCFTSDDCLEGTCLCGVCTESCSETADCPAARGAVCSLGDSQAYVTQCGVAAEPSSGLCLLDCSSTLSCSNGSECVSGACAHAQDYKAPLLKAERPPPPISGGTLALIDGGIAVAAADPEHDRVHIVSLEQRKVTAVALLSPGDEPGRVLQDDAGIVHVALRGAGTVVALDPRTGKLRERRPVCQYPRGLAYDGPRDSLHVACAGGELVSMPAGGGAPTRVLQLPEDLRDVVVRGDRLLVSRFRSAELLVLDSDGRELTRAVPPSVTISEKVPRVAWRLVPTHDGGVLMSHQLEQSSDRELSVPVEPGGYATGGVCGRIVTAAVTKFDADGRVVWWAPNLPGALPVDVAPIPSGGASVAPAGHVTTPQLASFAQSAVVVPGEERETSPGTDDGSTAAGAGDMPEPCSGPELQPIAQPGQLVAVAYDSRGKLVTQTRQPPAVVYDNTAIPLDVPDSRDTGHELFHQQMRSGIACASCHPEGTEDGHVWTFAGFGKRRTQSLGGRIAKTAPFHWSGDMSSFDKLVHEVMTVRMAGFRLTAEQTGALGDWIDALPAWKAREIPDLSAAERGRILFNDEQVGCGKCHTGEALTNNQTVDVGTGEPLQVPSLRGVSRRPPFMHDGCAPTLFDRFGPCGGGEQHGVTTHLTTDQLLDLTRYMESL